MCSRNYLIAHGRTYHIYNEEFKPIQNEVVVITLSVDYNCSESEEHVEVALEAMIMLNKFSILRHKSQFIITVFCFLLLSDTKKTMFYVLQLRPKLDYTF
jgi:hypothetical protein